MADAVCPTAPQFFMNYVNENSAKMLAISQNILNNIILCYDCNTLLI